MKQLLRWKYIDLLIQIAGGAMPVAYFTATGNRWLLLICYFILGGIQVASCLTNRLFLKREYKVFTRYLYEVFVVLIAMVVAVALLWGIYKGANVNGRVILLQYSLLFVTPGLAVLYLGITIAEIIKIRRVGGIKKAASLASEAA